MQGIDAFAAGRKLTRRVREGGTDRVIASDPFLFHRFQATLVAVVHRWSAPQGGQQHQRVSPMPLIRDLRCYPCHIVIADEGVRYERREELVMPL